MYDARLAIVRTTAVKDETVAHSKALCEQHEQNVENDHDDEGWNDNDADKETKESEKYLAPSPLCACCEHVRDHHRAEEHQEEGEKNQADKEPSEADTEVFATVSLLIVSSSLRYAGLGVATIVVTKVAKVVHLRTGILSAVSAVDILAEVALVGNTGQLEFLAASDWRISVVQRVAEGAERSSRQISLRLFHDERRSLLLPLGIRRQLNNLYVSLIFGVDWCFIAVYAPMPTLLAAKALVKLADWAGNLPRVLVCPFNDGLTAWTRAPHK